MRLASTALVLELSADGVILAARAPGSDVLPGSAEALVGRPLTVLISDRQARALRAAAGRALADEGQPVPISLDLVGGERLFEGRLVARQGRVLLLAQEVTERRRLTREVLETGELARRQVGRDLHDGLCQQLAGMHLFAGSIASTGTGLELLVKMIHDGLIESRRVCRGLAPVALEMGLGPALEMLAASSGALYQTEIVAFIEAVPRLGGDQERQLYRIAQEAVANAARHAGATRIWVILSAGGGSLLLNIDDDGCGLKPGASRGEGQGLRAMRFRAEQIGATLTIGSVGSGTTIACELPLNQTRVGARAAME